MTELEEMRIRKSKYTPGLTNGRNVAFSKGDRVKYRMRNGTEYDLVIGSELMQNGPYFGYECEFPDGRFFIVEQGIYDWEGKR